MIEPSNEEQRQAIATGIEFIKNGNPDEWLVIGGKAGTGKTTIAQAIIEPFIKSRKILVCALSHKAKLVISEKLTKAFGESSIVSKSVAGALGMNMDQETGFFVVDKSLIQPPPIKKADIIVVDEGSMINEESHGHIMKEKRAKAKHEGLKNGTIPRSHSFSLTYANKEVKEIQKKLEIAKRLWG